jgi:hypothetical protein
VGRLVRMHANEMEDITEAAAGDIVALFGVDCASGDTFTENRRQLSMTAIHVPEPVIRLAIKPTDRKAETNLAKALQRFSKEDPTFRTHVDEESKETIIAGMGELHLDVYIERMKREYSAEVEVGAPQVAYREAISRRAEFDYIHKKQTGGSGQYGRVGGYMEPLETGEFEFVDEIKGGVIPQEYIPSVEKGFQAAMKKGRLIGFPVTGLRVVLNDGQTHTVDSSDMAFQAAARGAFRDTYFKASPQILEPVMRVSVEGPSEFQGAFVKTVMQRRGIIVGTTESEGFVRVDADVPLAEMFGYSTDLRSATQGKAEYTMELSKEHAMQRKDVNARSPLRVLEASIHGGLGRGNLGVVVARHGIGKTAFLVDVALDKLLRGERVLHVSMEHGADKVCAFYDEIYAELAHAGDLEDVWDVRLQIERNRRIHSYLDGNFSVDRLRDALAFEKKHGDFHPSAIIIDEFPFSSADAAALDALRVIARDADAELWMSAVNHRDADEDESGVPQPVAGLAGSLDVILRMAHDGTNVHVSLLKDHDNPEVSDLKLSLDPRTLLLVGE